MEKIVKFVIHQISLPVWIVASIIRNRLIRSIAIIVFLTSFGIVYFAGWIGLLQTVSVIPRVMYGAVFMIVQFGAMFWFISRTKTIEVLPGDAGQITFDDYYGNEHLVAVTKQWLELLVDNKKLKAMGAQSTSGILLTGKPGVGKTYLAKALAGEADCAFLGIDGTSLTAMFLGIGALKVMNFANKARKWAKEHGACIWFIDEIDAIAGNRGMVQENNQSDPAKEWWDYTPAQVFRMVMGGMGGGGQAVLSRLLIEMDGMTEIKLRDRIENKMRERFGIEAIDPGIVL